MLRSSLPIIDATLLVLCTATAASAEEPAGPETAHAPAATQMPTVPSDDTRDDVRVAAARESTNPFPFVTRLKFIPSYTWSSDSTLYRAALQFEPALPFAGALVPGLRIDDIWSIARIQLTAESLQNSNGTTSGLENLNFVDVAAYRCGTLTLGAGVGTVFPMATSSELGPAKWQLGPAAGFNYAPAPIFSIAVLAQALWSVAGSNQVSDQSYVTVQPFITVHLDHGLVIVSDAQMSIYWEGGSTSIPVNLGVGYAFSKHFVAAIKGQLTVADSDDVGTFKGTLELAFLP